MIEIISTFLSKHYFVVAWVSILSLFGGLSSYIRKVRDGKIERFSIAELVGDIFISFFLGVVTYLICHGSGVDEYITAGLVGISSHLGTRGLIMLEDFLPKIAKKYFGIKD